MLALDGMNRHMMAGQLSLAGRVIEQPGRHWILSALRSCGTYLGAARRLGNPVAGLGAYIRCQLRENARRPADLYAGGCSVLHWAARPDLVIMR